jgi:mannosyl-3-phosphoglycerate phosphatase
MSAQKRLIIVTDLDGSLLDDSYSWAAALPALELIRERNIPLVLNSSKTMAEMRELANALGTTAPIVAENGGLLAVHEASEFNDLDAVVARIGEYLIQINGLSRGVIVEKAHLLREQYGYQFEGFADWSDIEIAERTGLCDVMASRAGLRHATEPILWHDTLERRRHFEAQLMKYGIRVLRGGRFLHLMGRVDKADGSCAAVKLYLRSNPDTKWHVVAVGDSANDLAMLEAADIAVVIPHVDGPHIAPNATRVVTASSPSSVGWNEAILTILQEFN